MTLLRATVLVVLLFVVAAFAKSAMDTRTFQDPAIAFVSCPDWFGDWMQRRGTIPIIKIDDGWHAMQAIMFLATGLAFLIAGTLFPKYKYWILLVFIVRAIVHGVAFEYFYPML